MERDSVDPRNYKAKVTDLCLRIMDAVEAGYHLEMVDDPADSLEVLRLFDRVGVEVRRLRPGNRFGEHDLPEGNLADRRHELEDR